MATLFLTFQALTTVESVKKNSFFSVKSLPVISVQSTLSETDTLGTCSMCPS